MGHQHVMSAHVWDIRGRFTPCKISFTHTHPGHNVFQDKVDRPGCDYLTSLIYDTNEGENVEMLFQNSLKDNAVSDVTSKQDHVGNATKSEATNENLDKVFARKINENRGITVSD